MALVRERVSEADLRAGEKMSLCHRPFGACVLDNILRRFGKRTENLVERFVEYFCLNARVGTNVTVRAKYCFYPNVGCL